MLCVCSFNNRNKQMKLRCLHFSNDLNRSIFKPVHAMIHQRRIETFFRSSHFMAFRHICISFLLVECIHLTHTRTHTSCDQLVPIIWWKIYKEELSSKFISEFLSCFAPNSDSDLEKMEISICFNSCSISLELSKVQLID